MIVTCHQCNFFPYSGLINKIIKADIFVLMGYCQFTKNNYQNRFLHKDQWYTLSVNKGLENINRKIYLSPYENWKKIKTKLPEYKHILELFDDCIGESLLKTNIRIFEKIFKLLNIKTKLVFDYPTLLTKTDRLVDLCKFYGATEYLSGPSGKNYLEIEKFKDIKVSFHHSDIPNMSCIEYLKEKIIC